MKNPVLFTILFYFSSLSSIYAQETFPVNGVKDERATVYAFTNGTIITAPGNTIENGTLLIKKDRILAAGSEVKIPDEAIVIDLKGKFIYPSLIDVYSGYGIKQAKKDNKRNSNPQFISDKKGAYGWNEAIHPEVKAHELFNADNDEAEKLRKLGFGSVLTHKKDGIARGSGTFVSLHNDRENNVIIKDIASAHYSFDKGASSQDYPGSLMGAIALFRQSYMDAGWYQKQDPSEREYNITLEEWNKLQDYPQIIEVKDMLTILRADKAGDEFGKQFIIRGNGDEYQRLEEIKATGASLIIPLNFPLPYDVEDTYDAGNVTLPDMKHWELAPANPAYLEKEGINFAITTEGMKPHKLYKNVRKAITYGLSEKQALASLTTIPAKMAGVEKKTGTLEKGKLANFIITSSPLFEKDAIIYQNWVQGHPYKIETTGFEHDLRGDYNLRVNEEDYTLRVNGKRNKPAFSIQSDSGKIKVSHQLDNEFITLSFQPKGEEGIIRLSGRIENEKEWKGEGKTYKGSAIKWTAVKTNEFEPKNDTSKIEKPELGSIPRPFLPYGWVDKPGQATYLIKGATIWTNEEEGILKNADLIIRNGKIAEVGQGLTADDAIEIDGSGMHLTPGIIDEHSHIAISRGVNEGTQAVTSEVRIGDVVDSENINLYRQLAGGVTTAQLLHGSANPVGGQSEIIKFRWGYAPEEMKFDAAPEFIKFALGENVKQSNWGDRNRVRFPQTRMGVEQVYYDAFIRAKEYEEEWKSYNSLSQKAKANTAPPRKDLELEALVEILNSERFITCHSYQQSEINMLMHVADSMGFRVNTFTHILEGYKVADKMKEHGVAASTFSDWWAYKYEVIDAIPYNGALLYEQGVVTAFNSDDAEMGRRLNQEAAKAVKYGGVPEEEALKFVTLNPAKILHIDDRVGSIKKGKDADIVLWSDHPLSIMAKAEKTFVDGILFFDREKDNELKEEIKKERLRLINKMLKAKKNGSPVQKADKKSSGSYSCKD